MFIDGLGQYQELCFECFGDSQTGDTCLHGEEFSYLKSEVRKVRNTGEEFQSGNELKYERIYTVNCVMSVMSVECSLTIKIRIWVFN